MSIENSLEGVLSFWKKNQDLIQQLYNTAQDAGETIRNLAAQLEQNRQDATKLVAGLKTAPFHVTSDAAVITRQRDLLNQIQQQQEELTEFNDSPDVTTGIFLRMADLYMQLADTFDVTIRSFIPFTNDEIAEINDLLQQAAVDAAYREKWADVFEGAVKLTAMSLKIAFKVGQFGEAHEGDPDTNK